MPSDACTAPNSALQATLPGDTHSADSAAANTLGCRPRPLTCSLPRSLHAHCRLRTPPIQSMRERAGSNPSPTEGLCFRPTLDLLRRALHHACGGNRVLRDITLHLRQYHIGKLLVIHVAAAVHICFSHEGVYAGITDWLPQGTHQLLDFFGADGAAPILIKDLERKMKSLPRVRFVHLVAHQRGKLPKVDRATMVHICKIHHIFKLGVASIAA
mmetsp:Transcript_28916/g.74311  ORF Transcript_28916/g.74311 Transcript_28916/m.74311 type:complete len:214 (+) Transcript_28916:90-731(+)